MNKKIIIIGGGVAGLSAGIYGQLNNYDTEIIEMHTNTGGQCTAWDRKGYRFDYCLRWLVGSSFGPFNDIWKTTNVINEQSTIINHEIYTRVVNEQNEDFIIYSNLDKWENYLINIAPEDTKCIHKMCNDMRKCASVEPFVDPPGLRKPAVYISALKKMFPLIILVIKYRKLSFNQYFQKLGFKNERLKDFFNRIYDDDDFSAIIFLVMLAWFSRKNAGYIMGGSLPVSQRMTEKFISIGGKLRTGKKVSQIIVEDNKAKGVILEDGTQILSDYVISAADGYSTIFKMLNGKYLSKQITKAYNEWKFFPPIVQVSFGINKEIKETSTATFYLNKDLKIGSTNLKSGYILMNYSFDPSMSPAGKTTLILKFDTSWAIWKDLKGNAYTEEKEKIRNESISLLEKHYKGISRYIEVIDIATPQTDVRYTGVYQGSYEGFLPSIKNFGENLKMTLPNLANFYMAGQWLFPGGGLPPSGQSGQWVIKYICNKDKKEFITK